MPRGDLQQVQPAEGVDPALTASAEAAETEFGTLTAHTSGVLAARRRAATCSRCSPPMECPSCHGARTTASSAATTSGKKSCPTPTPLQGGGKEIATQTLNRRVLGYRKP